MQFKNGLGVDAKGERSASADEGDQVPSRELEQKWLEPTQSTYIYIYIYIYTHTSVLPTFHVVLPDMAALHNKTTPQIYHTLDTN